MPTAVSDDNIEVESKNVQCEVGEPKCVPPGRSTRLSPRCERRRPTHHGLVAWHAPKRRRRTKTLAFRAAAVYQAAARDLPGNLREGRRYGAFKRSLRGRPVLPHLGREERRFRRLPNPRPQSRLRKAPIRYGLEKIPCLPRT